MINLKLIKSAINNFGYVDIDRKNLETIEAEIRADERRKFAQWLYEKDYLGREDNNPQSFTEHYWQELDVNTVLDEYEKEQKKCGEND